MINSMRKNLEKIRENMHHRINPNQKDIQVESTTYKVDNKCPSNTMASSIISSEVQFTPESGQQCEICKNITDSQFIILSCNHTFHINCLVEYYIIDFVQVEEINETFIHSKKCIKCDTIIDPVDAYHSHLKYISSTKISLENFKTQIDRIDRDLSNLNKEKITCLGYKHRIEKTRDRCEHIMEVLKTFCFPK